jgi:undecaprenyl diphosphate synthase
LPRTAGHKRGAEAVRRTVEAAREMGVSYLTLYAFSSENWKRPAGEVTDLMGLLRLYLRNEVANLHKNGIRLRVVGDRSRLSRDINALIDEHIAHVDTRIEELKQLKVQLTTLREQCHGEQAVEDCGIVQGLNEMDVSATRVREALLNNDYDTYKKMAAKGLDDERTFKELSKKYKAAQK